MGSRHLPAIASAPRRDTAFLARGAFAIARFAYHRVAEPAMAFLVESLDDLFTFIDEFADSADEVRKAMDRARWERYTISAQRR
jgi:hypothetical protein